MNKTKSFCHYKVPILVPEADNELQMTARLVITPGIGLTGARENEEMMDTQT